MGFERLRGCAIAGTKLFLLEKTQVIGKPRLQSMRTQLVEQKSTSSQEPTSPLTRDASSMTAKEPKFVVAADHYQIAQLLPRFGTWKPLSRI